MPDRLPSDHPAVDTHRVRVARYGGRRRRLAIPAEIVPTDEAVRFVLDGETRYGVVRSAPGRDDETLAGVYATPDAARDPGDATDHLAAWLDAHDVSTGESVLLDVIEPEEAYGLRPPGERAIYEAVDPPASSLQDIARGLEDG